MKLWIFNIKNSMTDNIIGVVSGVVAFVVGKETGVFNPFSFFSDIVLFVLVTVAAGFLGYIGKVFGAFLIKWMISRWENKQERENGKQDLHD